MTRSLSHCFISGQLLQMKDPRYSSGTAGFTSPCPWQPAQSRAFLLGIPVPGESPVFISSRMSWEGAWGASSRALLAACGALQTQGRVQAEIPGQEQGRVWGAQPHGAWGWESTAPLSPGFGEHSSAGAKASPSPRFITCAVGRELSSLNW